LRGNGAGSDLRDLAVKYGFVDSNNEYDSMLHELNIRLAKEQMGSFRDTGQADIAAVEAIDDINETSNILSERLKEWYILNFEDTQLKGEELASSILGMKIEDNSDLEIMRSFSSSLLEHTERVNPSKNTSRKIWGI